VSFLVFELIIAEDPIEVLKNKMTPWNSSHDRIRLDDPEEPPEWWLEENPNHELSR